MVKKSNDFYTLDDAFDFADGLVNKRVLQVESKARTSELELVNYPDSIDWMSNNFIDPVTLKLVRWAEHQERIIREALKVDYYGRSFYDLVIWSEPKKSGKTTAAGAVGAYVANCIEAPNEVSCVANDKEQSAARIFAAMVPTLESLNWRLPPSTKGRLDDPEAHGPNGTRIHAITTNAGKEAGGNQGISLWSELWAYKGERLMRLWEEMTPPPTRKFSMRWVESYAGFKNENILFQSLYLSIFKKFEEPNEKFELQDGVEQIWPDLPVFRKGRMLVYWSHDHHMPWQTETYYMSQAAIMRPNAYKRLHQNYWVSSDESFIEDSMWEMSVRGVVIPEEKGSTFALDGSVNGDLTALVGSKRHGDMVHTSYCKHWTPTVPNDEGVLEIDYDAVEKEILALKARKILAQPLWYDPFQCSYLAQRLRKKGVKCKEFPQGQLRGKADTFLYKAYNENFILNVPYSMLKTHILAASAVKQGKDENIFRIVKPGEASMDEKTADGELRIQKGTLVDPAMRKVDCAVAQSMSVYKAWHEPGHSGGWGGSGKTAEAAKVPVNPVTGEYPDLGG